MKKKVITIILGSLFLAAGVGVGVYLIGQKQDFRGRAAPATVITLVSSNSSPRVADTFVVSASIDTGGNDVVAAELYFEFDPTVVEVLDAVDGGFLSDPQIVGPDIDNTNGKVSYVTYALPGADPSSGSNEVIAKLIVKAKQPGTATFSLSPGSIVGATKENAQNVLVNSVSTVVNVQNNTGIELASAPTSTPVPTTTFETSAPTSTPTTAVVLTSNGATNTPTLTPTVFLVDNEVPDQLPDTGIADYSVFGIVLGALLLVGSLVLAL